MPRRNNIFRKLSSIELLVGFATLALLAGLFFPALAFARQQRTGPSCMQNLSQIGNATRLYQQDWDQKFHAHRFNCTANGSAIDCPQYANDPNASTLDATGGSRQRYYWVYALRPYLKSYLSFACPQNPSPFYPGGASSFTFPGPQSSTGSQGKNYGGQNSYGFNAGWLSPAGTTISAAAVPRPAGTLLATDSQFYVVAPDTTNASGLTISSHCTDRTCATETSILNAQGPPYTKYWENLGNANWSETGGGLSPADAVTRIKTRHTGQVLNSAFVDGHVKALPATQVVGDICLWTTDADGLHPNCK